MINRICLGLFISSILALPILGQPNLTEGTNVLTQLKQYGIWHSGLPLKLHLGCGENNIKGYVNIDFPPSEHTIQTIQGADAFANLIHLKFPENSVDEVRSHHVFEHFDRQTALALLCKWHQWLKVGGTLVIETPDFEAGIKMLVDSRYSYQQKQSILRHLCGSHEAPWAIHCDGWYKDKFYHVLKTLGFEDISFEFAEWQLTRNIIVRAKKRHSKRSEVIQKAACSILRDSMVDNSPSEEKMWQTWCDKLNTVYNQ